MSLFKVLSFVSLIISLALLGCGGEAPASSGDGTAAEEPLVETPACSPDSVVVGHGGHRVSRMAGVYVSHGEAPADFRVWVSGPGGKHLGEVYEGPGRSTFLPVQPFPAHATMTWHVRMCGEVFTGTFRTGALIRPVDEVTLDEQIVGRTFALDLRAGAWSAPFDDAASRLVYRVGGALLIDVIDRDGDDLRIAVTAAHPDNAGGYERDTASLAQVFDVSFADNPYATVTVEALALPTTGGGVTLRSAIIGLGFDDDGVTDAFVETLLEVDAETCGLLDAFGAPCGACVSADDDGTCVSLQVNGLYGVPLLSF